MKRSLRRNSPLFSELLSWVKNDDPRALKFFFRSLDNPRLNLPKLIKIYAPIEDRKIEIHRIDFSFEGIKKRLFEPLFIKKEINVRDEDAPLKHLKDNLFYRTKDFVDKLKKDPKDYNKILIEYKKDFLKLAPGAKFPFDVFLTPPPESTLELRKKLDALLAKKEAIDSRIDYLLKNELINPQYYQELSQEIENLKKKRRIKEMFLSPDYLYSTLLDQAKSFLDYISFARGEPGRHPKPFNVFIYHLINRFTFWKSKNGKKFYLKDGRRRLERYWEYILIYLLKFHTLKNLPELDKFIRQNKSKPALAAVRLLRKRLWDLYKNFPQMEGRVTERRLLKTGFWKLYVDNNGQLRIISL
jgi:hypothetical protein